MFGIHPTHSANAGVEVGKELTRRFRQIDGDEKTFAHTLITRRFTAGQNVEGEPLVLSFPLERKRRKPSLLGTIKSGALHCCEWSRDRPDA